MREPIEHRRGPHPPHGVTRPEKRIRARPGREGGRALIVHASCWTAPGLSRGPAREGADCRTRWLNEALGTGVTRRRVLRASAVVRRRRRSGSRSAPGAASGHRRGAGGDRRDVARTPTQRGARVGLALVGPVRHRPLGLGGDGERRVDARGWRRSSSRRRRAGRGSCRPGGRGRPRPLSGESPMVQPPMKWAVSGRLNGSPIEPPSVPPMIRAIRRTASLAAGIQVGFGLPWPCRDDITQPNGGLLGEGGDRVVERSA